MDTWDSEPSGGELNIPPVSIIKNKWEGEDAEEDVVDSWDQEEEEEKEKEEEILTPAVPAPSKKNNLKKLGEKLEEKERKKKQLLASKGLNNSEDAQPMTQEEILADKLKRQKLQEESDLSLAKEVFGVLSNGLESKEEYDKLKDEVLKLVSDGVKNAHFVNFTEEIIHSLCVHLSSTDLKKIHTWVGNLHIEKSKLEKGDKKKSKGKGKAKLKLEGDNDYGEYSAYTEDFGDFI